MVGVADFEGNGQRQARCTLTGLRDHDRISVDTHDPSLRPDPLGEAACLVCQASFRVSV